MDAHDGIVPLDVDAVRRAVEAMAARGLRVLAFARRYTGMKREAHYKSKNAFIGMGEVMHRIVHDLMRGDAVDELAGTGRQR